MTTVTNKYFNQLI